MSSLLRLQWLTAEIHCGRSAQVSFSYNAQSQKEKIKFSLDSSYQANGVYRPLLFGALLAAQHALDSSITTDKGHKSSDGCTVIEFWCKQPAMCFSHTATAEDNDDHGDSAKPLEHSGGVAAAHDGGVAIIAAVLNPNSPAFLPSMQSNVASLEVDVAMSEELTSDRARYVELEKQFATCDEKTREYIKQYHVLADLEKKHGPDLPSFQTSRSRMYVEVRDNAELSKEISLEMIAIAEKHKRYAG